MENLLFLGVPILKHIRVHLKSWLKKFCKQGPVVQSTVSLMSSLRGPQDFITNYTEFFCWKNERTAKASLIFSTKKYWQISDIKVWNFNETLTNDIVSFEQLGPGFINLPIKCWPDKQTGPEPSISLKVTGTSGLKLRSKLHCNRKYNNGVRHLFCSLLLKGDNFHVQETPSKIGCALQGKNLLFWD